MGDSDTALPNDPLWPRAGGWPSLAELDPGASVDLALLGVPAWRTSLSPTAAHATPAAIRAALRRYSPALMPGRTGSDAADRGPRDLERRCDSSTPATSTSPTVPRVRRARSRPSRAALDRTDALVALGGDNSVTVATALGAWGGDARPGRARHDRRALRPARRRLERIAGAPARRGRTRSEAHRAGRHRRLRELGRLRPARARPRHHRDPSRRAARARSRPT